MIKRITGILIALILLALLAYQSVEAAQYLNNRFKNKLLPNRYLDATVRSSDGSYGGELAGFISFLRNTIPENGEVLIPSGEGSSAPLNDEYLMQYFLFPREIKTCPSDCSKLIEESGIYIIAQNDFPPAELIPSFKHPVNFNDMFGLYVPTR